MKFETRNLSCLRQIRRGGKLGMAGLLILLFPMVGKAVEGYKLVCDQPVYDFGQTNQSAVITHVFKVRNDGDLTFALKYIHPGCSCTKAKVDKRMIGPGESANVVAVFTAKRRSGKQNKSVRLIPMDSNTPALSLYLKGVVEAPASSR
jgi:hypothetical protein